MYRILIKNREQNQTSNFKYSYYANDDIIFQTNDLNLAQNTFLELAENYLLSDLTIVKIVETNIKIDTPDLTIVDISNVIKLVNDGKTFSITLDLNSKALEKLVAIDVNEEMAKDVVSYLKSIGLTDVKVGPSGITAKNSTGKAVEGAVDIEKGLFLFYSRETQTSDYVSSSFSVIIKDTTDESGSTVIPTPKPGDEWPWPAICPPMVDPSKKNIRIYDDIKNLGSIIARKKSENEGPSVGPAWRGKTETESCWVFSLTEGNWVITSMSEDGKHTLTTTIEVKHEEIGTGDFYDYFVNYEKGNISTDRFQD